MVDNEKGWLGVLRLLQSVFRIVHTQIHDIVP
jgi:hypothetical protein